MSLFDDLQEDLLADALSAPAAKTPRNEWHEPVRWTFSGYIARCQSLLCSRCQRTQEIGGGVYALELASNDTRRLTRAPQFELKPQQVMEIVTETLDGYCFDCLVDLGFSEVEDPPEVPTNIAGQGITTPPKFRTSLGFARPLTKQDREEMKA